MREHTAFHFTLYEAARLQLAAAADPPGLGQLRALPARPSRREGELQDRHEELDLELLEACAAHDPARAGAALHAHLELATDIYTVELKGR